MLENINGSLFFSIAVFLLSACFITYAGINLAALADRLADRTGLGEAITGALLLGASTSLPGLITSGAAAYKGYPELAVSNAIGGIAAQTAFLAIADIAYRKSNLEHAAASETNILQGAFLIVLLSLPMMACLGPEFTVYGVHLVSPLMVLAYFYGMYHVNCNRKLPMWQPKVTTDTTCDKPDAANINDDLRALLSKFAIVAILISVSGYFLTESAIGITHQTSLSEMSVGAIFTAITTSIPELVTAIAAVRRNALTLAVSNIIGGNAFDTLFISVSDMVYFKGSIYHAITSQQKLLIALTILLTAILLMGLIRRERSGIANIGFESFSVLIVYILTFTLLFV